jgi:hypothetical protein
LKLIDDTVARLKDVLRQHEEHVIAGLKNVLHEDRQRKQQTKAFPCGVIVQGLKLSSTNSDDFRHPKGFPHVSRFVDSRTELCLPGQTFQFDISPYQILNELSFISTGPCFLTDVAVGNRHVGSFNEAQGPAFFFDNVCELGWLIRVKGQAWQW